MRFVIASVSSCLLATASFGAQLIGPTAPVPPEFFGMHIHKAAKAGAFMPTQGRLGPSGGSIAPTPWPRLSFRTWRLWDSGVDWDELEPAKNQWHFELLDQYVELAKQHDVEILLTLGQTPVWASSRPTEKGAYQLGNVAEPRSLDDWRDYVRTVATRYKGSIHAYEIWNEPNLKDFYTGSIEEMALLTREASTTLKNVDPTIQVVSASSDLDFQWLGKYLRAGAAQYIDVVGFHFYMHNNPEEVVDYARKVKSFMAENGAASKPLWNTEEGWGRWTNPKLFPSGTEAAAYVARSYILNWVSGISRFCWYAWDNFWWVTLNMTEPDRHTEKPAAQAYRTVQSWLVGAVMKTCDSNADGNWKCELRRNGSTSWILWNTTQPGMVSLSADQHPTTITDLDGAKRPLRERSVAVSESPVLIQ